jgi:HEAT repeat protein
MYIGFVVVAIASWVMNRQRNQHARTKIKSSIQQKQQMPTQQAITDSNWTIRLQALETLLQEQPSNLLDILLGLLEDTVIDIRSLAASGIVPFGDDAIDGLAHVLQTGSLPARESAIQALLAIDTPDITPVLIQTLQTDESAWVRVPAIQGLALRGGDDATQALVDALNDTHPDVQTAVHQALQAMQN